MSTAKHENRAGEGPQVDKFRELARELECDEDEEAFRAKLKKVARPHTGPHPEKT